MIRRPEQLLAFILFLLPVLGLVWLQDAPPSSSAIGTETTGGASLGKEIYKARCTICHGVDGKGDGVAAALITPRPRDFTAGKFKFRTTESGSIPTDDDLERIIKHGAAGTAMPAWEPFLRGDSLKAVIAYVKSFSPRFEHEQPKPIRMSPVIPGTPASIAAGKRIYERLQCAKCHGVDGEGTGAVAQQLTDDWGYGIEATKLTEPWTFRNGSSSSEIYSAISAGLDGTPMPSYSGAAKGDELRHVANYVVSLARKPVWSMDAAELDAFYRTLRQRDLSNPVKRGKYLSALLGCKSCHTPLREDGTFIEELQYAGGQRWGAGPYGSYFTNNITPDKATGLGDWTDEQIKQAIVRGIGRDGRRFIPLYMPWTSSANLTDEDQNALIAYLRSIPAIHNQVPGPEPLNIFSYMVGKFKMLILHDDFPSIVHPGNAGDAQTSGTGKGAHQ